MELFFKVLLFLLFAFIVSSFLGRCVKKLAQYYPPVIYSDTEIRYILDEKEGEIIAITHRPGEEAIRTIIHTFPPGTVKQKWPI